MHPIISLFIALLPYTTPKPITYYVEEELNKATRVCDVAVFLRPNGKLGFVDIARHDTLAAQADTTELLKLNKAPDFYYSGTVPNPGDTVLYVGTNTGAVFYAERQKEDYRLWSPTFPWSIPIFVFSKPFRPIPGHDMGAMNDSLGRSWDGCLVAKAAIDKWRK